MAVWYVLPNIAASEETDSYVGEFGVGKLRDSWADVTWTSGDAYYQGGGTTFVGTVNVSTGGASEAARIYIKPFGSTTQRPKINGNQGQFGWFVTGSQSFVTIQGFEVYGCNNASAIGMYKATGAGTDVHFTDNVVYNIIGTSAAGIKMFCDRGKYLRNTIRQVSADGIFVEGDDVEVGWNDVDFIDLDNNLGDCVQVADTTISSHNPWIHDNKLRHTQTSAKQVIVLQTTASNNGLVVDNECYGSNSSSHKTILILQPGVQVNRNKVTGGVWGIGLQGTGSTAAANIVTQTYSAGIGILVDAQNCSARNNTVLYNGTTASTVPGISHFNVAYTGCTITNNISRGFAYGIRAHATSATESYNNAKGVTADFVNESLTPVSAGTGSTTADPGLRVDYVPTTASVRSSGTPLGGLDYYLKSFGSSVGAVEYCPPRTLVSRSLTTRTTETRTVATRRGITA